MTLGLLVASENVDRQTDTQDSCFISIEMAGGANDVPMALNCARHGREVITRTVAVSLTMSTFFKFKLYFHVFKVDIIFSIFSQRIFQWSFCARVLLRVCLSSFFLPSIQLSLTGCSIYYII